MTTQITFTEELYYSDDPSGIAIPIIISYGDIIIRDSAKVDTGAEVCLFKYDLAEQLEIQLESGIPKMLNTLTGSLEAFGHEVIIQTGDLSFRSFVYFAKYPGLPRNILGRQGRLRNLKLAVVDYDNLLYLSEYDS